MLQPIRFSTFGRRPIHPLDPQRSTSCIASRATQHSHSTIWPRALLLTPATSDVDSEMALSQCSLSSTTRRDGCVNTPTSISKKFFSLYSHLHLIITPCGAWSAPSVLPKHPMLLEFYISALTRLPAHCNRCDCCVWRTSKNSTLR